MKRLAGSLKGRLLLIMLGSMAALQLLSFGAIGISRGYEARHLANDQVARDLHRLHGQVLAVPAGDRAAQLPSLRRGSYHLEIWPESRQPDPATTVELRALQRTVAQALHSAATVLAATVAGQPALLLPLDAGQRLAVVFDVSLPSSRPEAWQVLLYVGAIFALVALLSVWAVSAITRPLEQLTAAGRRMVGDIASAAPLKADGPAEVRSLAADLNTMQAAVQRQLRERTFMLAAISHDLKTPLTRLKLRLGALTDAQAPVAAIDADLNAMDSLVTEGLAYAQSAQLREARLSVDLGALLESLVDQSADVGHAVRLAPVPAPVTVLAAPRALARLVQNLIDNALRYGAQAEVSLHPGPQEVEIQVADRGPGVPPQERDRLFEPFVRGEASRDRSLGGTGLGLAIAHNIAVAHGGRIWLSDRPGGGLVVHVALPRGPR